MTLLGKGALVIWHDIPGEHQADYKEWHAKEHVLERVGVPGFRRGHCGEAVWGAPGFLNWYEVEDLAVLTSRPYLERLNDPTPWTRKAMGYFRDNNRTLCRVVASAGAGVAGHLLTQQVVAAPGRDSELGAWLAEAVPRLVERAGIIGAHYFEGDAAASRLETEEKRLRESRDAVADRVLLVGGHDAETLEALCGTVLSPTALATRGSAEVRQAAVYRMLHCVSEADLANSSR